MANIIWSHTLIWGDPNGPSLGSYTIGAYPPGTNVYACTGLSQVRQDDNAVTRGIGVKAHAFIQQWSVYSFGEIRPVFPSMLDPYLSAVFIDNCYNITFAAYVGFGIAGALATVFSR